MQFRITVDTNRVNAAKIKKGSGNAAKCIGKD